MFFMQHYEKPKHWYQRSWSIRIPVWPLWLAQWVCEHERKTSFAWGNDRTVLNRCIDCNKVIQEPVVCKHPYDKWEVMSTEMKPTAMGGGQQEIPSTWRCGDCGYPMRKDMQCPTCNTWMEITEWAGLFSGRFHCQTCGQYFFREELE